MFLLELTCVPWLCMGKHPCSLFSNQAGRLTSRQGRSLIKTIGDSCPVAWVQLKRLSSRLALSFSLFTSAITLALFCYPGPYNFHLTILSTADSLILMAQWIISFSTVFFIYFTFLIIWITHGVCLPFCHDQEPGHNIMS